MGMPTEAARADPDRSQRERELSSLYATARSLAALGEVDEVLAAIVRHAHDLMRADLTYLSVLEAGHLRMRASEGTVSPRFTRAEVSSTTGIGGRVIATRSPFWVSNYLTESEIEHSTTFDALVRDEGLVALLGVPLLAADRVLGILYVADRVERPYDADQVALLSALADHASIALENARLYEESRSALARLQIAYRTIERSGQVHEALGRVVLTGGGESEVAALLHQALGGRVTMIDRRDRVVATRTDLELSRSAEPAASSWRDALLESRREGRSVSTVHGDGWQTVTAITTGDTYLGAIAWRHPTQPDPFDVRTVERASHIVGLLTLKQDAVVQAEERLRGEVLTELIRSSTPLSPELVSRGRAMRLDFTSFTALVLVETDSSDAVEAHRRLTVCARDWAGLVGIYAGRATLAVRSDDLQLTVRSLHRQMRSALGTPVLVCAAALDGGPGGFSRAFTLASRCARVLSLAGVDDVGTTTVENGMYAALFDPERGEELDAFMASTLGDLVAHDERNNTVLVATVTEYFANNGNVARTARAMHVHANTLLKRLDRVASVLGEDWNSAQRALPVQLAVRLHQLRTALGD
jgi:GAF domain-containing protein